MIFPQNYVLVGFCRARCPINAFEAARPGSPQAKFIIFLHHVLYSLFPPWLHRRWILHCLFRSVYTKKSNCRCPKCIFTFFPFIWNQNIWLFRLIHVSNCFIAGALLMKSKACAYIAKKYSPIFSLANNTDTFSIIPRHWYIVLSATEILPAVARMVKPSSAARSPDMMFGTYLKSICTLKSLLSI